MQNQTAQPNQVSDECRIVSGQLAEWGIEFSQDRVLQLSIEQRNVLQNWINAGVDADESYQELFESLPEFMENELLEMSGKLSSEPQELIIEQAINAYEAEASVTSNPYLFDTNNWHLWRKAYCHWHRGETLNFSEEPKFGSPTIEDQQSVMDLSQQLVQLSPQLIQTDQSLKKLRSQLKKTKRQRKAIRKQQSELLYKLCDSISFEKETPLKNEKEETKQPPCTTTMGSQTQIIRIPVTGPDTNRVEVHLLQDRTGHWRAGHLWSVDADARTGQLSRGSRQPDLSQITFPTETEALMNELLDLSRGIIGVAEIESQIIDYLNLLEEYPGQIAVCGFCHRHYINEEIDPPHACPECSAELAD
ncbi:MAG: hypothetical protein K0U86_11705 [Planctomycetes bacterium]|nr:hypothetical protein [Planctomycetota bacterium]MCH9725548.1 hypothetical protein [Planctomycetota bacterium]MCH9777602.1 hypothetical protein [Planctomycetota bacterium]MCH9789950.1 hypothetical protein [Planctomycetota bacterium]